MQCPTEVELGFFLVGMNDKKRAVEIEFHLDDCPDCQRRLRKLPAPPARQYGRPMPHPEPLNHVDREKMEWETIAPLRQQLVAATETGLVIKIGGNWMSQELIYIICAILAIRLERKSGRPRTVGRLGQSLTDIDAPKPTDHEFALLLEAPTFRNLDEWLNLENTKQVRILVGSVPAWEKRGYKPDVLVEPAKQEGAGKPSIEELFAPYFADLRIAVQHGTPQVRAGILMAALDTDIPKDWFGNEPAPNPFIQLEDDESNLLPYYSLPGTWLTAEFLRRRPELMERLGQELQEQNLPENIRERLRFQQAL